MENDVLDALEDVGYTGAVLAEGGLEAAVAGGPKNVEYTKVVEWLCKELKVLCKLDETVNAVTSEDEASNFSLEVSCFLMELGCSYAGLVKGHPSDRLSSRKNRLLLLDFLLTELMAARMNRVDKPDLNKGLELKLDESATAGFLKTLLIALRFPKPPANITSAVLFAKVESKLKDIMAQAPADLVGKPLFTGVLSDKQWRVLSERQAELQDEYRVRRDMLVKRLDVTIQSFQWSDQAKKSVDDVTAKYSKHRGTMLVEPSVRLADLLAAREDLAIMEKTSNASVRKNTQSAVNKVMIGRVPDRGGRPSEQEAPPPEMPSWQKDRAQGGGGRGGSDFSRGGGRGGRVQGGWNKGRQDDRGSYQDNRGGYQDSREGYYQDNRGGNQDSRGGYYQDNRGSYQDNRGGNQDSRGCYQDSRGGYQDNRGEYADRRGGYGGGRGHSGGRGQRRAGGRDRRDYR